MMMMKAKGDDAWYRPQYDLGNCWIDIARSVVDRFDRRENPESYYAQVFKSFGITDEEVAQSIEALAQFFNKCREPGCQTPKGAFEGSGMLALSRHAQAYLMFQYGLGTLCSQFYALRSIEVEPACAAVNGAQLSEMTTKAIRAIEDHLYYRDTPWWKRLFNSLLRRRPSSSKSATVSSPSSGTGSASSDRCPTTTSSST